MAVNGEWLNSYTNKRNDDKGAEPEGVITGLYLRQNPCIYRA